MIDDILHPGQPSLTCLILRIALTAFFWWTGLAAIRNFRGATEEVRTLTLPYPTVTAALVIVLKLAGSLIVIANPPILGCAAASALALFTLATIPLRYSFWRRAEPVRTEEFHVALEHLGLVGGLLIATIAGPGR